MAEAKATKTTTRKTTTRKKAEPKVAEAKVVETKVEAPVTAPQFDFGAITPEMFAQFQAFMAMQQGMTNTTVAPDTTQVQAEVRDKRWLKTIKDREVRVTSCYGYVTYISKKTGETTKWLRTGDDQYMTVQEILDMDNQSAKFLRIPWLYIEDNEVVEAMGLSELYSYIKKIEDVDAFLKLPLDEIEEVCNNLSHGFKDNLAGVIDQKIENQELRDVIVIRKLQELLKKDFSF